MADVDIVGVMMRGAFPHLFDGTDMFPRHRPAILKQTRDEMCAALSALTAKGFAVVPERLLNNLVYDLQAAIDLKYAPGDEKYPTIRRRMLEDLQPVIEARKILGLSDYFSRAQEPAMLAASQAQSPTPPTQTGEK